MSNSHLYNYIKHKKKLFNKLAKTFVVCSSRYTKKIMMYAPLLKYLLEK